MRRLLFGVLAAAGLSVVLLGAGGVIGRPAASPAPVAATPPAPRVPALEAAIARDQQRLKTVPVTAQPNRLGVLAGDLQGFPNGRRLTDDVVDISLQAVEGAAQTGKLVDALAAGDKVDANDNMFGASFPYVALPNVGAVNKGGGTGQGAATAANVTPKAFTGSTNMTAVTVGSSAVAVALGALLYLGWRRRRSSVR